MKLFTHTEVRNGYTTHQLVLDFRRVRIAAGFVRGTMPTFAHSSGLNNERVWIRQFRAWRIMAGAQVYRKGYYPGLN